MSLFTCFSYGENIVCEFFNQFTRIIFSVLFKINDVCGFEALIEEIDEVFCNRVVGGIEIPCRDCEFTVHFTLLIDNLSFGFFAFNADSVI